MPVLLHRTDTVTGEAVHRMMTVTDVSCNHGQLTANFLLIRHEGGKRD